MWEHEARRAKVAMTALRDLLAALGYQAGPEADAGDLARLAERALAGLGP